MAKFDELFDDVQEVFDNAVNRTTLERQVKIKIVANDKLKEIYKVVKTNDLTKYLSDDIDVVIIVNQVIFDQLEDDMKDIVADEALAYINFDPEKDKVTLGKTDLNTFTPILKKYGFEAYEQVQEVIKSLFETKRVTDDETDFIAN